MRTALIATTLVALAVPALADDDWFPPVDDATVQAECGACHMAFSPAMLPARSWRAMMADLSNHFGEDAWLPAETAREIEAYLVANAADSGGRYREVLDGIAADATPLRISATPWWIDEHEGEVRPGAFDDPKIGSKANCVACHRDAERGYYEDD